jgi:hypothetical protein
MDLTAIGTHALVIASILSILLVSLKIVLAILEIIQKLVMAIIEIVQQRQK